MISLLVEIMRIFAILPVVMAEIGLVARSSINEINGLPVRINNGHLEINGDGPMLQAFLDSGAIVLSDRVVAPEAAGSGIGVDDKGLMIVSFNSSTSFYNREGWLEYNGDAFFGLKPVGDAYEVYAGRPELEDANPTFLQLVAMAYPSEGIVNQEPDISLRI